MRYQRHFMCKIYTVYNMHTAQNPLNLHFHCCMQENVYDQCIDWPPCPLDSMPTCFCVFSRYEMWVAVCVWRLNTLYQGAPSAWRAVWRGGVRLPGVMGRWGSSITLSQVKKKKKKSIYIAGVLHCICYICTVLYILNLLIHLDIFSCASLCWFHMRFIPCRCWHLVGGRIFGLVTPCTPGRSALMPSLTTVLSLCMTAMAWRGTSCGATGRYDGEKWTLYCLFSAKKKYCCTCFGQLTII